MLHQACNVSSPLIQISDKSCPDILDRIGHIRIQLNAIEQAIQAPAPTKSRLQQVRDYLDARASAHSALGEQMFSDPAWDILVQLYAHDLAKRTITLSKLCAVARVPAATNQRWIRQLEQAGHIERTGDPLDTRKNRIQLTCSGRAKMEAYFRALG